jgi:hypothetical protein
VSLIRRFRPYLLVGAALLARALVEVAFAQQKPTTNQQILQRSCAFGTSLTDGLDNLLAGAFIVIGLLMVVLAAVMRRGGEGGGMMAGALIGSLDFGGAALVLGVVVLLATLVVTAVGLPSCPTS